MWQQHVAAVTRCAAAAAVAAPATPYCPFGSARRRLSHCAQSPALVSLCSEPGPSAPRGAVGLLKHGGYWRASRPLCFCKTVTKTVVTAAAGRGFRCRRFDPDKEWERKWSRMAGRPAACAGERSTTTPTNRASQLSSRGSSPRWSRRRKAPPPSTTGKNGVAGACTCTSTCSSSSTGRASWRRSHAG